MLNRSYIYHFCTLLKMNYSPGCSLETLWWKKHSENDHAVPSKFPVAFRLVQRRLRQLVYFSQQGTKKVLLNAFCIKKQHWFFWGGFKSLGWSAWSFHNLTQTTNLPRAFSAVLYRFFRMAWQICMFTMAFYFISQTETSGFMRRKNN